MVRALVALPALVATAALVALAPLPAFAADAPAGVNWESRVLQVKGSGAPDTKKAVNVAQARLGAERAAKVDAYRQALEQLKGVSVTSGSEAGELLDDAAVRAKVEAVIRGAKIVDTKYFEDGGVDVFLEVPIDALSDALVKPPEKAAAVNTKGENKFTGLVVDARGLKVTPALAPRLLDDKGGELYGTTVVNRASMLERGVAGYTKKPEEAKDRVGDKPLVVKATAVNGADLSLAAADVSKLRDPKVSQAFLADARVVIVTD